MQRGQSAFYNVCIFYVYMCIYSSAEQVMYDFTVFSHTELAVHHKEQLVTQAPKLSPQM